MSAGNGNNGGGELAARLAGLSILTLGDVMLDRYWSGDVERISPEAPVPVIHVKRVIERAGGAANVARGVAALGARSLLAAAVGDDAAGDALQEILERERVAASLTRIAGFKTTVKLRLIGANQQMLRADFEEQPDALQLDPCFERSKALSDEADALVISDYGKGGVPRMEELIGHARAAGKAVVIDPACGDFTRYKGAALLTPNSREFEHTVGPCRGAGERRRRAFALIEELSLGGILITRSEHGMELYRAGGEAHYCPANAREVFDVTGAGDTVTAVAATLAAAGLPWPRILEMATAAAALVVGRLGTAVAGLDEITGQAPPPR